MPYRDQYEDRSDAPQPNVPWGATRLAIIGMACVIGVLLYCFL